MAFDRWFNVIRIRLRQIPLDRRRTWTAVDLHAWIKELRLDSDKARGPLPQTARLEEICRDLIGETATD
jgi:hypothetical protein